MSLPPNPDFWKEKLLALRSSAPLRPRNHSTPPTSQGLDGLMDRGMAMDGRMATGLQASGSMPRGGGG